MDTKLFQQDRNNFSFVGLTENYLDENPGYIKVYDFEKHDYVRYYVWLSENTYILYSATVLYIVGIFALQQWMKNREAFELRKPLFFWNLILAGFSMVLLSRLFPEVLYVNQKYGFYRSYCKRDHFNVATIFWLSLYTASKIFEFVDTTFIVLRKQKLTFLHVFHHTTVYIACVLCMIHVDPASRYFALMNSFVHSVMYSYYALKAAQFKLPRKLAMAVTAVQLVQFTCATIINLLVLYAKVMGTEPHCERPNDISAYFIALGLAYLFLFGKFFVQTYLKKNALKEKRK